MGYSHLKVKQLYGAKQIIDSPVSNSEQRLDRDITLLSYIYGKPETYYRKLSFKSLGYYRNTIAELYSNAPQFRIHKYIIVNGKVYKLLTDCRKFSAGRFLGLKAHIADGIEKNFNKIVALCYKPLIGSDHLDAQGNYVDLDPNDIERMENAFNNTKLSKLAGGVFFYLNVSNALNGTLQIYLSSLMETEK